jgi:hypothetical protein
MLDAERMGGETDRSTGTNPAEISLTNLTGTALTNVATASSFTSTNNRMIYLTPGMLVLSNGGGLNTNDLRYVTTGLRHWTNAYERIPLGLFYSNCGTTQAGKKKYCLEPVSRLTVADIRDHITSNCPPFAANGTNGRAGGMDGTAYVTALAANIIDYVDTDSTPTTTNINGVNIVGFDNYPMLTHVYDSFLYSSNARTITHTTWLQFWNPSTQTTPSNTITLNFTNNDIVKYLTNTIDTNSLFMTNRLYTNPLTTTNFVIPDISANAGYVTNFVRPTTSCNNFSNFPNPAPSNMAINFQLTANDNLPRSNSITNSFSYRIGTNTNSTITPAMNLYRLSGNVLINNSVRYSPGFLAGNKYVAPTETSGNRLPIHDPRMTPYLGQGSENLYIDTAISTTYWRGYVSQSNANLIQFGDPAYWPDGSNTNLTTVQHGALRNGAPDLGLFTNAQPAPCKISNAGSYSNIVELGNIFDPIQWAPPNNITTTYLYSATNIASNWDTNNLFGGGSTLRIGRPEHPRFAWTTNLPGARSSDPAAPNMQQSAAALLDLFCVSPNYSEAGKINLNTAPAPVLRALAGGILLANAGNHAVPSGMTEAFAQGIMRFRAQYPFYSPSQLAFINTSTNWSQGANGVARIWPSNAVFGNTNTIFLVTNSVNTLTNTSLGITGLNDQAAEEWFSKIFQLSTVSSRNFRVYVIAQKATTNSSGASIGVGPVVRKYYNLLMKQNGYETDATPTAAALTTFQSYY